MQNIPAPAPREPQEGWGCEGTRTRTGELAGGGGGGGSGGVRGEQREGQERIGVQKEKEGEE